MGRVMLGAGNGGRDFYWAHIFIGHIRWFEQRETVFLPHARVAVFATFGFQPITRADYWPPVLQDTCADYG